MKVKGRYLRTVIDVHQFLAGLIFMLLIVSCFIATALVLHVIMVRKHRSDYALGLTFPEVARFARTNEGDIQGEELFLKLHTDFPHLTVSGVSGNCGTWTPNEVLGKKENGDQTSIAQSME